MARYAKQGSTRTDILEAMFNELKKDGSDYEIGDVTVCDIKSFIDIDPSNHEDLVEDLIIAYLNAITCCDDKSATFKDVHKINFDFENCGETDEFYDKDIVNHRQLKDGTAIIWCYAGGDWEFPVHFVLYLDPKNKVRAYVPSNGNVYCHKCKCALGTCDCEDQLEEIDDDYYTNNLNFSAMMEDVNNRIETK